MQILWCKNSLKNLRGTDIRAFVVGDYVVAAMRRTANEDEFRSNLHRGGVIEPIVITEEESRMAIKASKILGLQIAGVDLMRSSRGPLILEVNSSPGLQGIEASSNLDVAGKILSYIRGKI